MDSPTLLGIGVILVMFLVWIWVEKGYYSSICCP